MTTWSTVRIGALEYGGSPRGDHDPQVSIFNSGDLIRHGEPNDEQFLHVYRITVSELRRRLDALGFTPNAIRLSLVEQLQPLRALIDPLPDMQRERKFIDQACRLSTDQLIALVREWRDGELAPEHAMDVADEFRYLTPLEDFDSSLITILQGDVLDVLPGDPIYLNGLAFDRLLADVFEDNELFDLDYTDVMHAGYFEGQLDPVGNAFDTELASKDPNTYVLGGVVAEEESVTLEFKSVVGRNPTKAIADQIPKYIIGFLNQIGGRVLFGIADAGTVEGVSIRREQRDELQRQVAAACVSIAPSVPLRSIEVNLRSVVGAAHYLEDRFVVEIVVPPGPPHEMYFKGKDTWVRFGTETRALVGHQLFAHILSAYHGTWTQPPRTETTRPNSQSSKP